jgi:hypothetical protein
MTIQDYRPFIKSPEVTEASPWGKPQHIEKYGGGVVFVSTSSHGGFYVPPILNLSISEEGREFGKKWAHDIDGWYEEDCAAAYVLDGLPELFKFSQVRKAREIIKNMGGTPSE